MMTKHVQTQWTSNKQVEGSTQGSDGEIHTNKANMQQGENRQAK
jgi:hypothetical protein